MDNRGTDKSHRPNKIKEKVNKHAIRNFNIHTSQTDRIYRLVLLNVLMKNLSGLRGSMMTACLVLKMTFVWCLSYTF